jgi:phospholipid-binding lipoprotein MlaA
MKYTNGWVFFALTILTLLIGPKGYAVENIEQKANVEQSSAKEIDPFDETFENEEALVWDEPPLIIKDDWETFNRAIFAFNDKVDFLFLKPAARIYNAILPDPISNGLHNMFTNLKGVIVTFNDLLQANFYQANSDAWRFLINSTVGMGGFFDVADQIGLPLNTNDFGLTLGKWGYENSIYVMLPLLGPSTFRDTIALPVDYYASIYPHLKNVWERTGLLGASLVDERAKLLQFDKLYEEVALDKYIFMRDAYFQHRRHAIEKTKALTHSYQPQNEALISQVRYFLDE